MSLGISGVPQNNQQINTSAKEVRDLSNEIGALKTELNNLSNELLGGQSTSGTKQGPAKNDANNAAAAKQAAKGPQSSDYISAEAIAIAANDEDNNVKKRRKKSSLDEKLEMLMALEEMMDGAVLDDPDDQAVVDQFFRNMNQVKNLIGRLRGLEEKEQRLEDELKQMKEEGRISDDGNSFQEPQDIPMTADPHHDSIKTDHSKMDSRPSNLPPHIQITQFDEESFKNDPSS